MSELHIPFPMEEPGSVFKWSQQVSGKGQRRRPFEAGQPQTVLDQVAGGSSFGRSDPNYHPFGDKWSILRMQADLKGRTGRHDLGQAQ